MGCLGLPLELQLSYSFTSNLEVEVAAHNETFSFLLDHLQQGHPVNGHALPSVFPRGPPQDLQENAAVHPSLWGSILHLEKEQNT